MEPEWEAPGEPPSSSSSFSLSQADSFLTFPTPPYIPGRKKIRKGVALWVPTMLARLAELGREAKESERRLKLGRKRSQPKQKPELE